MQTIGQKLIGAILRALLGIAGCSKDESTPTENQPSAPPLPNIVFKGPSSSTNGPGLVILQSYVANANSLAIAFAPFVFTTPVHSGNTWTWTFINKTLTMALTAANQTDGTNVWNLFLDGTDPTDGTPYAHWLGVEGTTSADGKSGNGKSFVRNKSTVSSEFNWTTTNNILTGTLKPYNNGTMAGQTVIINNPDNSGEVRAYAGSILVYKSVWLSNGSGQWWTYDANGVQTGTGSWT
jgi:hypothetical protein